MAVLALPLLIGTATLSIHVVVAASIANYSCPPVAPLLLLFWLILACSQNAFARDGPCSASVSPVVTARMTQTGHTGFCRSCLLLQMKPETLRMTCMTAILYMPLGGQPLEYLEWKNPVVMRMQHVLLICFCLLLEALSQPCLQPLVTTITRSKVLSCFKDKSQNNG